MSARLPRRLGRGRRPSPRARWGARGLRTAASRGDLDCRGAPAGPPPGANVRRSRAIRGKDGRSHAQAAPRRADLPPLTCRSRRRRHLEPPRAAGQPGAAIIVAVTNSDLITRALAEDVGDGDVTTEATVDRGRARDRDDHAEGAGSDLRARRRRGRVQRGSIPTPRSSGSGPRGSGARRRRRCCASPAPRARC